MWSVNDPLVDRQYTKELLVKRQDIFVSTDHQCAALSYLVFIQSACSMQANAVLACVLNAVLCLQQHLLMIQWSDLYTQSNISCNTGAAGEAVPVSEPVLPPALPSALPQPSLGEKVASKGGRASKGAAKPAKAVELPAEIFQRDEPFVLPPAVSKVRDVCSPACCLQGE